MQRFSVYEPSAAERRQAAAAAMEEDSLDDAEATLSYLASASNSWPNSEDIDAAAAAAAAAAPPPPWNRASASSDEDEDDYDEEHERGLVVRPAATAPAAAAAVAAAAADDCVICWEEDYYGHVLEQRGGAGGGGVMRRMANFRELIFEFERLLRVRQNDEVIFTGMLQLRRTHIESYLESHGVAHTPWTREMLRKHYCVHSGHRFDALREYAHELRAIRELGRALIESAIFDEAAAAEASDPANSAPSGSKQRKRAMNLRAIEIRLRVSREHRELVRLLNSELRAAAPQHVVHAERVLAAVAGSNGGGVIAANSDTQLALAYDVGGLQ